MGIVDGIVKDYKYNKYKDEFIKFRVSPVMATVSNSDDGINIIKLVRESQNYDFLKDSIIVDLLGPRENDYLIFSLLFGLYFDTFNLYNYRYINPEVRRDIAITEPNRVSTKKIIEDNDLELFLYFQEKYGIGREEYDLLIKYLFDISIHDSIYYNNSIIVDFSKILMGFTLNGSFTTCQELIDLFDRKNENNYKKLV